MGKEISPYASSSGTANIIFIFAIFLLTSLHTQIGNLLIESSRILHFKNIFLKENERENIKIISSLTEYGENIPTRNITHRNSSLVHFESDTFIQTFQPLMVYSKTPYTPILWRKFLKHTEEISPCSNTECIQNETVINKNSRFIHKKLSTDSLHLILDDTSRYLAFTGSLEVKKHLFLKKAPTLPEDSAITILFAVFDELMIEEIILDETLSQNTIQFIFYSSTSININKTPKHGDCLNKYNTLSFFISAPFVQINGKNADVSQYGACIRNILPLWFPERKIIGYLRIEP